MEIVQALIIFDPKLVKSQLGPATNMEEHILSKESPSFLQSSRLVFLDDLAGPLKMWDIYHNFYRMLSHIYIKPSPKTAFQFSKVSGCFMSPNRHSWTMCAHLESKRCSSWDESNWVQIKKNGCSKFQESPRFIHVLYLLFEGIFVV